MKVPLSWLKEYVDWPWSAGELAERLTMAGAKIETVETLGDGLRGVVAAKVLRVTPHPNPPPPEARAPSPDRHWVVTIEAGGRHRQVVAGVANVDPGDVVAYAPPGSTLPGGWDIGVASVRGVQSEGMLCSLSELVLGEKPREGEVILVLPADLAPGSDVGRGLGLPETLLELDLTPNYAAHCQSLLGVAREVAAQTGVGPGGVRYPEPHALLRPSGDAAGELAEVTVSAPDLCPRYVARVIRGVKLGPSPWWLQLRVLAAGMRPINNIVDITNYVMLEYGQPLHAFDLARVRGRHIVVRTVAAGETIVTLDGVSRALDQDMLVIADDSRPVAVAGVMGGESTEVTADSRDILLESASFDPRSVRRTAARLGVASEAAVRFDKGTDPEAVEPASARAAALMADVAGGTVAPGSVDRNPRPYVPREVPLRTTRVSALLGVELERAEVSSYLRQLGFGARPVPWADGQTDGADFPGDRRGASAGAEGNLLVGIPSWRTDVSNEADLVEEVARLYGYNRIPATLPRGGTTIGTSSPANRLGHRVRRLLAGLGFTEAVTFSLVDPATATALSPTGLEPLTLANPLLEAQAAMRTGLLGGLVAAVAYNLARTERCLRLFELGTVYRPAAGELAAGNLPDERRALAAVATGEDGGGTWRCPSREPDFYDAKGWVEAILRELGVDGWVVRPSEDRRFHPGRQACAGLEGSNSAFVELGVFGELHPRVLRPGGVDRRVLALEFDFEAVTRASRAVIRFEALPRFPAVGRDVAVVLPDTVEAATIEAAIRRSAGGLCAGVELFDVYRGRPVPQGHRSTAWRVIYRSPERSLTDAEVDEAHERVRAALEQELGATLR